MFAHLFSRLRHERHLKVSHFVLHLRDCFESHNILTRNLHAVPWKKRLKIIPSDSSPAFSCAKTRCPHYIIVKRRTGHSPKKHERPRAELVVCVHAGAVDHTRLESTVIPEPPMLMQAKESGRAGVPEFLEHCSVVDCTLQL
mmetsp:Transcript_13293/g.26808  ORF Transcript_13293/g.26808 Transcript_13293/m.26808 type:complete len:142 (+) Transcript_13293:218-643(+)